MLRFRLVEGVIRVVALLSYEDAAYTLGFAEGEPRNPEAKAYKNLSDLIPLMPGPDGQPRD